MVDSNRSQPGTATSSKAAPAGTPAAAPPAKGTPPTPPPAKEPAAQAPTKSKAETLADLLRDDPPADDTDGAAADDSAASGKAAGAKKAKPKKLNDLAEPLGVEASELYKLEVVTAADGSPVTVEQLKDYYGKRSEHSVAQLQWEEDRSRQQADLVRANAELRELLAAIPRDKLDAKVLEAVRTKHEASIKRERARTLQVIPEWVDESKRTEDLAGMAEYLQRFGFDAAHLKSVYDHRLLSLIRDAWKREARVKAALEAVQKVEPTPTPKPGKANAERAGAPRPSDGPTSKGRAGLMALLE